MEGHLGCELDVVGAKRTHEVEVLHNLEEALKTRQMVVLEGQHPSEEVQNIQKIENHVIRVVVESRRSRLVVLVA